MRKIHLLLLFLLTLLPLSAQVTLSDSAQISLLTASPYEGEVFTLYGHTALRINDPSQQIDYIFNYGIFSFNKPNFIYRFTKGETDYQLGISNFQDYIIEYQMRGSEVTEQVLNLTSNEKEQIWQFLLNNYKPENREYRYNFFFDNCSTRPRDIIEQNVDGKIIYTVENNGKTFRDLISYCTRNHPWLTFGCDLALGAPTDKTTTSRQEMFLPLYLKDALATASILSTDGSKRNLLLSSQKLSDASTEIEKDMLDVFTPAICGWILLLIVVSLTCIEWKRKTYFRAIDIILFLIAGLAGSLLFFLSFISEHPCTYPNWSLIWLNPLQLVGVILFSVKKLRIAAYYYHFINFAALTLLFLFWNWIPQQFNPAFIPLILTLWVRSGYSVYRFIKKR